MSPAAKSSLHVLLALMTAMITVASCGAQNFHGSLIGQVQDATGERVAGAGLLLRAVASAAERETHSDNRGEFRIDGLQPDVYQVTVTAAGFAEARSVITIVVSSASSIIVRLKPQAVRQEVKVQGEASSIATQPIDHLVPCILPRDHDTGFAGSPARRTELRQHRVSGSGTEPVEPSDPTKARITAVSTGGSSGLNNELRSTAPTIPTTRLAGSSRTFHPTPSRNLPCGPARNADTGGTTAGSVVITTRRGTNEWHGDGAFYERQPHSTPLSHRESGPKPKQPFSRQNYVGTLGGPIVKNKAWFFSLY